MERVHVGASQEYDVVIGRGLLGTCGEAVRQVTKASRCCVITDTNVRERYAGQVVSALEKVGLSACLYTFPAGEQNKNLTTYGEILEYLADSHMTRSDCVVALGGGVTGDMAGFAAATYQRGIDYIQMPTTFLAASDSSVGGKTAVDLGAGKNLVGAFCQPKLVLCDCDTFDTLPEAIFAEGVAENLKNGLIADSDFFHLLLKEEIHQHMEQVVRRSVEIKADVVGEDEFEQGRRKLLNFGHTLGHAIEKCSHYTVPHGQAVATGMVLATRAAERLGYTPKGTLDSVVAGNRKYGLPVDCPYTAAELYEAATSDKKCSGGGIDVVVLEKIGQARTVHLSMDGLREFVEAAL